ncbi:MAG: GNAT family N-acetyltransferase [Bacteroidota bacterium]
MIPTTFETSRLSLKSLSHNDLDFIMTITNSEGWLKFIGNRNTKTKDLATEYIQKIIDNPQIYYWTVTLKQEKIPIGVITFIKRDYHADSDIGFAFLPGYEGKGYAYESSKVVLDSIIADPAYTNILATTLKDNVNSIKLIEKLGLKFEKEIKVDEEALLQYSVTSNEALINKLVTTFFSVFANKNNQSPLWETLPEICLAEALIIKKTGLQQEVYTLKTFTEPRVKLLSDGTLTEFIEEETNGHTTITGNIAQRMSNYQKSGYLSGTHFTGKGIKLFQFIKTGPVNWKISSVVWEDEMV